ncbi:peptidase M50 [Planomonospora sphaerica]|uniref:Zinc metalloprotease n=1 Tax=Planomonospora sphaerica TaxID=161355 RepID=A0A161LQ67_9ACTN|nr:site-2 protease family protein [Planomonospora sphaerica]GAT69516.1 peptidase M50 [Planomonospora sphaerica]
MKPSLRLGRVAGIPIGIHWSGLLIVAMVTAILGSSVLPVAVPGLAEQLYWSVAAVTAPVFFASLLAHELAHALIARRRGIAVRSVTLWMLGGVTELDGQARTPRAELEISAAGPLTSLAVAGAAFLVMLAVGGPPLLEAALAWLAVVNAVLGVFNLLPGAPLDGGRVLHAVLWWRYRDRARADRTAAAAGERLGLVLVAAGIVQAILGSLLGGLWTVLIGWFLTGAARSEAITRTAREGLRGLRMRDVMAGDPDLAPAWSDLENFTASVALQSRQSVFPVVDFSGTPVGSVSLEAIAALAPERRAAVRVAQLARPLPAERVLAPDEPAERILERPAPPGEPVALIVEADHVIGMVTAVDLTRILSQAVLRHPTEAA